MYSVLDMELFFLTMTLLGQGPVASPGFVAIRLPEYPMLAIVALAAGVQSSKQ